MPKTASERPKKVGEHEPLWTRQDVARLLNVDVRAIDRMPIPRVTLPGRGKKPIVRYDPEQVRAWLDARRSRPIVPVTAARRVG
jgi:hypothetical protein